MAGGFSEGTVAVTIVGDCEVKYISSTCHMINKSPGIFHKTSTNPRNAAIAEVLGPLGNLETKDALFR